MTFSFFYNKHRKWKIWCAIIVTVHKESTAELVRDVFHTNSWSVRRTTNFFQLLKHHHYSLWPTISLLKRLFLSLRHFYSTHLSILIAHTRDYIRPRNQLPIVNPVILFLFGFDWHPTSMLPAVFPPKTPSHKQDQKLSPLFVCVVLVACIPCETINK